ncbi:Conserved hypothetical protein [gamma proteobacterium HdN1]|nr:Conserved hypothetical protein [gamma proteobacterium HdN1]
MTNKIVVDTSVFISALIGPKGPSRELLRRCFKGEYLPVMGNALFNEYEAVRSRGEIISKCKLEPIEIEELTCSFYSICEWISIFYLWRPNLKDEGDNHVIELAVAANASVIATNNISDFSNTELHFPGLAILKPEQILGGK